MLELNSFSRKRSDVNLVRIAMFALIASSSLVLPCPVWADGWVWQSETPPRDANFFPPTTSETVPYSVLFQWQSSTNAPAPTDKLYFKVTSTAEWQGQGSSTFTPTGTADDGFGDSLQVSSGNNVWTGTSSGAHLIQIQPSGSTVTISKTLAVTVGPNENGCGFTDFSAVQDTRGISISSAVDPTWYKDPSTGARVENVRGSDGTMKGDTFLPPTPAFQQITYTASATGNWSPVGTTWHWNSSTTGSSAQGDYPNIQNFSPMMPEPFDYGSYTDHVFFSMYDGQDGAEASGNYYMNVHAEWEPVSWPVHQIYKVMGTDPYVSTWPTYPWQVCEPEVTVTGPVDGTAYGNISFSAAGFKDYDCGLALTIDPVEAHFGATYQAENEVSCSVSLPVSNVPQNYEYYAVWRYDVTRTMGLLDHYDQHGYTGGTGAWRQDGTKAIDAYIYGPVSTSSTITDPPSGWNPPGYS